MAADTWRAGFAAQALARGAGAPRWYGHAGPKPDPPCRGNDDLIGCLMEVLRSARALAPSGSSGATGPVEDYFRRRLSARLVRAPHVLRTTGQWGSRPVVAAGCGPASRSSSATRRGAPSTGRSLPSGGATFTPGSTMPS